MYLCDVEIAASKFLSTDVRQAENTEIFKEWQLPLTGTP
jgi:hypothetical protein